MFGLRNSLLSYQSPNYSYQRSPFQNGNTEASRMAWGGASPMPQRTSTGFDYGTGGNGPLNVSQTDLMRLLGQTPMRTPAFGGGSPIGGGLGTAPMQQNTIQQPFNPNKMFGGILGGGGFNSPYGNFLSDNGFGMTNGNNLSKPVRQSPVMGDASGLLSRFKPTGNF